MPRTRISSGCWAQSNYPSLRIADAGQGLIFVTDRTIWHLSVVDPVTRAIVADVDHDGHQLSSIHVGAGVDVIDYNPTLSHLFLPGATSATMAIVGVSASGTLSLLGTVATARDAHCVAADTHGTAWVCDPDHGQLLRITDPFPAAGT